MDVKYNKILIALDETTQDAAPVLESAVSLAAQYGAQAMLLHVAPSGTYASMEDRLATLAELHPSDSASIKAQKEDTLISHRKAWLEGLCKECEEKNLEIQYTVEVGSPGPSIVDLARRWKADLIVLGPTHRSKIADAILGSVSSHVIHHSPCSLLFVR